MDEDGGRKKGEGKELMCRLCERQYINSDY